MKPRGHTCLRLAPLRPNPWPEKLSTRLGAPASAVPDLVTLEKKTTLPTLPSLSSSTILFHFQPLVPVVQLKSQERPGPGLWQPLVGAQVGSPEELGCFISPSFSFLICTMGESLEHLFMIIGLF